MNIKQQFVILSAELATRSSELNKEQTLILEDKLIKLGVSYAQTIGSYKGVLENSFIVVVPDQRVLEYIKRVAFEVFSQESILYSDVNGTVSLEYAHGSKPMLLGRMQEINANDINNFTAYTKLDNRYFVAM